METDLESMPNITIPNDKNFERERKLLVLGTLVMSSIVIFGIETFLMFFLESLHIPQTVTHILDGLILVITLLPLNYFFIVRPMTRNISEHHNSEQKLFQSYEMLEKFFSISDIFLAYMDSNFNFVRVNKTYAEADGHETSYFPGKNHFDLYPNEENQAIFEGVVKTGKPYHAFERPFEYPAHPERGTSYWDWSLLPVRNNHGQVVELLLSMTDVTFRKKAQAVRAEFERRFSGVFNQAFQHIALLSAEGKVQVANQTAMDFTGATQAVLEGKPFWLVPWWGGGFGDTERIQAAVQKAASGEIARCECRVLSAGGDVSVMDITIKPLVDDAGLTTMLIYEGSDITNRIRAEEALKRSDAEINRLYQSEKRGRLLAETLRDAASDLSSSLNSDTVLEIYLDHLHRVAAFDVAYLMLLDDDDHLVVRLVRGEEKVISGVSSQGRIYQISDLSFVQLSQKDCEVVVIDDTSQYAEDAFLQDRPGIRNCLAIPLLAGEKVIGVTILGHAEHGYFTENLIHWASALTSQAAAAIQNAWLFEQVRDNRERLQALSRRMVEVQELERHHIARELHDEAGQALASLMVGLRLLERDGQDMPGVALRCQELKGIADGVLENLHRLAIDLRPSSLDHLGLVPALRQHTETVSDQHNLTVQFEMVGEIGRLPDEIETSIYRIVQEALTNVVRHAHATRADVLLERREKTILLLVEDNGRGFDPDQPREGQLGLVGMRERAEMLGGKFSIESEPGYGTTVIVEVKCPSNC